MIKYRSHVRGKGWLPWVFDGGYAGTTNESRRLEAVQIISDDSTLRYRAYVQGKGWLPWQKSGGIAGTTGKKLRIEAFQIVGKNIYYHLHIRNTGWLNWVKSEPTTSSASAKGAYTGTIGKSIRAEAIQITNTIIDNDSSKAFDPTAHSYSVVIEKEPEASNAKEARVDYCAHVQKKGWLSWERDGETAGTTGQSLRLEAFKAFVSGINAKLYCNLHIQNQGWTGYKTAGSKGRNYVFGTIKKSKRIEAVRMKLEGGDAEKYSVVYRLHVQNKGWLGWATDGRQCGSTGESLRAEAIQIKIVPKSGERYDLTNVVTSASWREMENDFIGRMSVTFADLQIPNNVSAADVEELEELKAGAHATSGISDSELFVNYRAHVQNRGTLGWVRNGATAGTTGKKLRLEKIWVKSNIDGLNVNITGHLQNVGWSKIQTSSRGKEVSVGTEGQKRRIEAVKIWLSGKNSKFYSISYRMHVQDIGWLEWSKDGAINGTTGQGLRTEAIQIKLSRTSRGVYETVPMVKETDLLLNYRAHVQNIGWQDWCGPGETAGTTGKSLRLEAIQIYSAAYNNLSVGIDAHIQKQGWTGYKWDKGGSNYPTVGTTGKSLRLEAVRIKLGGKYAYAYTVGYRLHLQGSGWTGWAYDGQVCGTVGQSRRAEAIQIKLVKKSDNDIRKSLGIDEQSLTQYIHNLLQLGTKVYLINGSSKLFTGTIWDLKKRGSKESKEVSIEVYDRMMYLSKNKESRFYPSGWDVNEVVWDICKRWDIPLQYYYITDIANGKIAFKNQSLMDEIKKVLDDAYSKSTVAKYICGFRNDYLRIQSYGNNSTVYHLAIGSIISAELEESMENLVTVVVVLQRQEDVRKAKEKAVRVAKAKAKAVARAKKKAETARKKAERARKRAKKKAEAARKKAERARKKAEREKNKKRATKARVMLKAPANNAVSKSKDEDDIETTVATQTANTQYGTIQEQVYVDTDGKLSDAIAEANKLIEEQGDPETTLSLMAPDIPFAYKGDLIAIHLSEEVAGMFYIVSVTHNITDRTMQLELEYKK